jgi:hypothetical protein
MTEPLTRNRVNIKAILADHLLREELIESATDFICKVEGIRRKENLKMTELSPAAQAVLDAATAPTGDFCLENVNEIAAAALRVAADQVVPEPPVIVEGGRTYEEAWTATVHDDIRRRFLAIATELEGVTSQ